MKRTVRILRVSLLCGCCLSCWCYYSALYSQLLLSPLLFAVAAAAGSNTNGNSDDLKNKETATGSSRSNATKNSAVGNEGEVIILSAVDGTLAGISRSSGRLLWKQQQQQQQQQSRSENDDNETTSSSSESNIDSNLNSKQKNNSSSSTYYPIEWNKFLAPLVSTTTTIKK